jgi:methionine-gamma-lyase
MKKGFSTIALHGGNVPNENGAHITPIYNTSTYLFKNTEHAIDVFTGAQEGYIYGRFGSPSTNEAEEKIALLETHNLYNTDGTAMQAKAILHSSGMAALSTLFFSTLKTGDKILSHLSLYGGTQELLDKVLPQCGVQNVIVNFKDLQAVETTLKNDNTIKLIHIETPANPTIQCVDIEAICNIAKQYNVLVSADNTFATPYIQQPFKHGVDFIMHSTTKFLNGHGTAIGGVLIGKNVEFMNTKATKHHRLMGGNSNGLDAFLLTNGIKTLAVRMDAHCKNAKHVAEFLQQHKNVNHVNYLGFNQNEDFAIAQKQMKNPGALLSFDLKAGFDGAKTFLDKLNICTHAVSLGTCDTLVCHSASSTHFGVPREKRLASGITDGLIRMSVGLENYEDIIADLEQALA